MKSHLPLFLALAYSLVVRASQHVLAPDVCTFVSTNLYDLLEIPTGTINGVPGDLDVCLCQSSVDGSRGFVATNQIAQLASNDFELGVGEDKVIQALMYYIASKGATCIYPDNALPICSEDALCDFTCTHGFTRVGDTCACPAPFNICAGHCQESACTNSAERAMLEEAARRRATPTIPRRKRTKSKKAKRAPEPQASKRSPQSKRAPEPQASKRSPQSKRAPEPQVSKRAPSPQSKRAPSPQSKRAPSPQSKRAPSPQSKRAPVPQASKRAPSPQSKRAPSPQSKRAPSPQSKRAPVPQRSKREPAPRPNERVAEPAKRTASPQVSKRAPVPQVSKRAPVPQASKRAPSPQSKRAPSPQSKRAPVPQASKRAPSPQSKRAPVPQVSKRFAEVAGRDEDETTYEYEEPEHTEDDFTEEGDDDEEEESEDEDKTDFASLRERDYVLSLQEDRCRVGQMLCGGWKKGVDEWECVDTRSTLDSCGGCIYPYFFDEKPPTGADCSSLPGAVDVECRNSRCIVHSCQPGYVLSPAYDECIPTN